MSYASIGRLNTAARETLAAPQATSDKWSIDSNPWKVHNTFSSIIQFEVLYVHAEQSLEAGIQLWVFPYNLMSKYLHIYLGRVSAILVSRKPVRYVRIRKPEHTFCRWASGGSKLQSFWMAILRHSEPKWRSCACNRHVLYVCSSSNSVYLILKSRVDACSCLWSREW